MLPHVDSPPRRCEVSPVQKAQRLLDLAAFLLRAAEPVSWREIQEQFADDYGGSGEAAIRKFERDKADLLELAIPIRYEPGDEDLAAGYLIDRDEFYLPDLKLPPEDLAMLYLAGSAALASGSFPYSRDLAHAMNKLSFAARAPGASEAAALATHHLSRPDDRRQAATSLLEELSRAVATKKRVQLVYAGAERRARTERDVDPYGLFQKGGAWFVTGWCHLRKAQRTFHLARIEQLTVNAEGAAHPRLHAAQGPAAGRGGHPGDLGVHRPRAAALPGPAGAAGLARGAGQLRPAGPAQGGRRRHRGGGRRHQRRGAGAPRPLAGRPGRAALAPSRCASGPAPSSPTWPGGWRERGAQAARGRRRKGRAPAAGARPGRHAARPGAPPGRPPPRGRGGPERPPRAAAARALPRPLRGPAPRHPRAASWRAAAASPSRSCSRTSTSSWRSARRPSRPTTSSTSTWRATGSTWRSTRASPARPASPRARRRRWRRRSARWAARGGSGPSRRCATRCRATGAPRSTSWWTGSTPGRRRPATRCWAGCSAPSPSGARSGSPTSRPPRPPRRSGWSHPFTLAQRLGHWYLYGHDASRDRPLAFRIDRIRDCALTDQRFEPPSDAELARARLFSEPTGEAIRVRLGPLAAEWALARPGGRGAGEADRRRRRRGGAEGGLGGVGHPLRPLLRRRRRGDRAGQRGAALRRGGAEGAGAVPAHGALGGHLGGARGVPTGLHHLPLHGGMAPLPQGRDGAEAGRRGDAGRHHRHLHRQDRHAHHRPVRARRPPGAGRRDLGAGAPRHGGAGLREGPGRHHGAGRAAARSRARRRRAGAARRLDAGARLRLRPGRQAHVPRLARRRGRRAGGSAPKGRWRGSCSTAGSSRASAPGPRRPTPTSPPRACACWRWRSAAARRSPACARRTRPRSGCSACWASAIRSGRRCRPRWPSADGPASRSRSSPATTPSPPTPSPRRPASRTATTPSSPGRSWTGSPRRRGRPASDPAPSWPGSGPSRSTRSWTCWPGAARWWP